MEENKDTKWARGLNKDLVRSIIELKPENVEFLIEQPIKVYCYINIDGAIGGGLSICSILDKFDLRIGKNKAAGRAIKAIINKEEGDPIRNKWEEFPDSWTKRQIQRVRDATDLNCKSLFFQEDIPEYDAAA